VLSCWPRNYRFSGITNGSRQLQTRWRVFHLTEAASATRPSPLEEEVVSLFEQLRTPILRYLLSFRISVPDAEEVLQEVFLALFQHLRQGKPEQIFRVGFSKWRTTPHLKCRLRSRRHSDRFSCMPDLSGMTSDPGPDAGGKPGRQPAPARACWQWCGRCRSRNSAVCSLRAEGLRYREIAEVLGMSLGSVAASLEKSLSRLTRAEQT
jgi:RNA polymerase sigma-70 factor (ECF subfamily)